MWKTTNSSWPIGYWLCSRGYWLHLWLYPPSSGSQALWKGMQHVLIKYLILKLCNISLNLHLLKKDRCRPYLLSLLTFSISLQVFVCLGLTCRNPVETPYYTSPVVMFNTCVHCGDSGASRLQEQLEQYKTVLPVCPACVQLDEKHITARPRPGVRAE